MKALRYSGLESLLFQKRNLKTCQKSIKSPKILSLKIFKLKKKHFFILMLIGPTSSGYLPISLNVIMSDGGLLLY